MLAPCAEERALFPGESVRGDVATEAIPHADHPRGVLTFGVGLAGGDHRTTEVAHEWLDRADRALYAAKRKGRDRVCRTTRPAA